MAAIDLDGYIAEDGSHRFPLRVYYDDTDAGGVVYHANYLRFMERGRTAMLHLVGLRQSEIRARDGVIFAVRKITIDYSMSGVLDDALEVVTRISDIRGASFAVAQSVCRDGKTLAEAEVIVVAVNTAGKAVRVSDAVRTALAPLRVPEKSAQDGASPG